MRGELLGLVKSTSAFKDLGLSSHTTCWSPCPLCLVQARSTLSELDNSMVHPDVRKRLTIVKRRETNAHSMMSSTVTGCLFAPVVARACMSIKRHPSHPLPCLPASGPSLHPKSATQAIFLSTDLPATYQNSSGHSERHFIADGPLPIQRYRNVG